MPQITVDDPMLGTLGEYGRMSQEDVGVVLAEWKRCFENGMWLYVLDIRHDNANTPYIIIGTTPNSPAFSLFKWVHYHSGIDVDSFSAAGLVKKVEDAAKKPAQPVQPQVQAKPAQPQQVAQPVQPQVQAKPAQPQSVQPQPAPAKPAQAKPAQAKPAPSPQPSRRAGIVPPTMFSESVNFDDEEMATSFLSEEEGNTPTQNVHYILDYPSEGIQVDIYSGSPLHVGRAKKGVNLRLMSSDVSRHHARFDIVGTDLFVKDLGSTNGTKVNGKQIQAFHPVQLGKGDSVSFPSETLVVL